jgi:hypothetical protein
VPTGGSNPRVDLVSAAGIAGGLPGGFVPRCRGCRYDLRGLADSKCPECGAAFTLAGLIADWRARQDAPPNNWDFILGALLAFVAGIPMEVRDPVAFVFKACSLIAMWVMAWVWFNRRAEEMLDEGHRLLWLWVPCAASVLGLLQVPLLNLGAAFLATIFGVVTTVVAWRRSPAMTVVIATTVLTTPIACIVIMGFGLLASATAGKAHGHYWSPADYPAWYWRGVPGRVRGMDNGTAIKFSLVMIATGAALAVALVPMWIVVGRAWLKSQRTLASGRRRGPNHERFKLR